ncbi:MAG TPA: TIGR03435 family protein [Bryobacteraceae bacterium]|nr:TIGR03435 family protein [Bryobacteraceae bacterium]
MKYLFALALVAIPVWAQTGGFDVISIKSSDPLSRNMHIGIGPSGSFEASGVNLMSLITQAYDVRGFQIVGGTGWMNDDRYTIVTKDEAKGPSEADLSKMNGAQQQQFRERLMAKLRAMLADRFQLKIHRETKEMPVYELTVAKGGVKMETAPEDGKNEVGLNSSRTDEGRTGVTGKRLPMNVLTRFLSNQLGRTVLDRTGLAGNYNFKLVYSADMGDTTGPSIFTALQEQLGLKLEAGKGPVEVVVIDRAEKPSGN